MSRRRHQGHHGDRRPPAHRRCDRPRDRAGALATPGGRQRRTGAKPSRALPAHKIAAVRAAIQAKGAQLFLLPPYSPEMNPIEMVFAKLKTLLRQALERTREGLWNRSGELLDHFSPEECANYFRAAGYGTLSENALACGIVLDA